MLLGAGLLLAAGVGLRPEGGGAGVARVAELRDRFLVDEVARPMRARLRLQAQPSLATYPPLPFLLPFPAPSCVEQVCALVGSLGCDTDQRILRVLRMCSGNVSGDCVRAACAKMISVACDSLEAIAPMVAACSSNFSGRCLEEACRRLGDVQCQNQETLARILEACAGNYDAACVSVVCGKMGPDGCSRMDELAEVARACGGY